MNDLFHARQFLLGPRPDPRLSSWQRLDLRHGLVLQTHPNLECMQRQRGDRSLTLIGFALTLEKPAQRHPEMLDALLEGAGSLEALLAASDGLSGRWILILEDAQRSVLFQDATGLRTAVHTLPANPETWVASQPALIAHALGLQPDPQALDFWEASGAKIPKHIRAWPGAATAFAALHALLPNHYLDLRTREVVRFFPREHLEPISLADGTRLISEHLRDSVAAAHARYQVLQQVTAGLDSRAILAASRGHRLQTGYFTCIWPTLEPGMTEEHRDVAVPRDLLGSLGLPHKVYSCPDGPLEAGFAQAFATCDSPPLAELGPAIQPLLEPIPPTAMVLNGNGGEIGRCRLHPNGHPPTVALPALCNLHWPGMGQHPFVQTHLAPWLSEAGAAAERTGYRLLDLFYWEQKMSRRVARGFLHLDIAHETFSPYNSRALLRLYLAVPEQHRRPAEGHVLQHAVIRELWPAALDREINPATVSDRGARLWRRLRRRARGLGLPV